MPQSCSNLGYSVPTSAPPCAPGSSLVLGIRYPPVLHTQRERERERERERARERGVRQSVREARESQQVACEPFVAHLVHPHSFSAFGTYLITASVLLIAGCATKFTTQTLYYC